MVSPTGGRPVSPPHSTTSSASNWAGTHWSTLDPRVSLCLFPIRKSSSAFQSIEREIRLDRKPIGYVYSYAASGKWIKTSNCWRAPMHTRFVEEDSSMFYLLSGRFHKRRWSEIVDGQSAGEQQAEYSLYSTYNTLFKMKEVWILFYSIRPEVIESHPCAWNYLLLALIASSIYIVIIFQCAGRVPFAHGKVGIASPCSREPFEC